MAQRKTGEPGGDATVDRILRAAITRFARAPYEETGLRSIAADAGVDVAYVHRRFGSKEALFTACLHAKGPGAGLGDMSAAALIKDFIDHILDDEHADADNFDLVLRSLTSPEASRMVRASAEDYVTKIQQGPDDRSAGLVLSLLFGVAVLRNVVGLSVLKDQDRETLRQHLHAAVAGLGGASSQ